MWRHQNIRGNPHRGGVEREWPNNIASLLIRERGLTLSEGVQGMEGCENGPCSLGRECELLD